MDQDVNSQEAQQPQAEPETAGQQSLPAEQTNVTPEVSPDVQAQERTVPISVLQGERKKRQELQRQLAAAKSATQLNQYDPEDINMILQHPMVQELILKDAKRELTDYARDAVDQYPALNPQVKKAILKNARGFVNETTTDIEQAKVDLLEYIEEIAAEVEGQQPQTPAQAKGFPVAATNVPTTQNTGARPADIQKILNKSVDSWTDEEVAAVEAYANRSSK